MSGRIHERLSDFDWLEKALEKENTSCLEIDGPSLPPLCGSVPIVWGNRVYLFGGFCGGPVNDLRIIELVVNFHYLMTW